MAAGERVSGGTERYQQMPVHFVPDGAGSLLDRSSRRPSTGRVCDLLPGRVGGLLPGRVCNVLPGRVGVPGQFGAPVRPSRPFPVRAGGPCSCAARPTGTGGWASGMRGAAPGGEGTFRLRLGRLSRHGVPGLRPGSAGPAEGSPRRSLPRGRRGSRPPAGRRCRTRHRTPEAEGRQPLRHLPRHPPQHAPRGRHVHRRGRCHRGSRQRHHHLHAHPPPRGHRRRHHRRHRRSGGRRRPHRGTPEGRGELGVDPPAAPFRGGSVGEPGEPGGRGEVGRRARAGVRTRA